MCLGTPAAVTIQAVGVQACLLLTGADAYRVAGSVGKKLWSYLAGQHGHVRDGANHDVDGSECCQLLWRCTSQRAMATPH